MKIRYSVSLFLCLLVCTINGYGQRQNNQVLVAYPIKLTKGAKKEGDARKVVYDKRSQTYLLDQLWAGTQPSKKDFIGSFKVGYSDDSLYIKAIIKDDTLADTHADPLVKYWDDDCLEIFIDPDASGGPHQFSHNAWAYHIALNGDCVDFGPSKKPSIYPHCKAQIKIEQLANGRTITHWQVAIALHKDDYQDSQSHTDLANKAIKVKGLNQIGFAVAYCDNDHSAEREHFMGSVAILGQDKNQGYKNAYVFGLLRFKK